MLKCRIEHFYCCPSGATHLKLSLNKIQAAQNFACRIFSGAKKHDHVTPILNKLKWLPIRKQLYLRKAILVFKCINGPEGTTRICL